MLASWAARRRRIKAPARKLTAAQRVRLIDKAVIREKRDREDHQRTDPARRDLHPEHATRPRRRPGARVRRAAPHPHRLRQAHQRRGLRQESRKGKRQNTRLGGIFKHSLGFASGASATASISSSTRPASSVCSSWTTESFDRQTYNFGYVRNEFLGSVPTAVFDVTPIAETELSSPATINSPASSSAASG